MKTLKYLLTIVALTSGLALQAKADALDLGGVAFSPPNSVENNQTALGDFLGQDVSGFTATSHSFTVSGDLATVNNVMDGCYLVVHYGTGAGGSNPGGQLEFFLVENGETSVTVPAFGPGGFGFGGISSVREFCPPGTHVPDSGTTAMLLGSALTGLGLVRRYLKR